MSTPPSPRLRLLGRYASEVLVIIIGITLSFLFDEWRQERNDRRAEREYLTALRADLRTDSVLLAYNIGGGGYFLRATERLTTFQRPGEIADSLHILVDAVASYAAFNPSTATYEELHQTGRMSLLRDDTLRRGILALHGTVYAGEREISAVDKAHVVSQLIPALSVYFPLTTDSVLMAPAQAHITQLGSPRLRNILITGAAFKRGVIQAQEGSKAQCTALLSRLENLLKEEGR